MNVWIRLLPAVGFNFRRPVVGQHFAIIVEREQVPVLNGMDTIGTVFDGLVFHDAKALPGREIERRR